MLMEDLIHRFKTVKNTEPMHANELLDFIRRRLYQSGNLDC